MRFKSILVFIAMVVVVWTSGLYAQNMLTPFESNGKWGFKNEHNEIIIKPDFVVVQEFTSGGIAAVLDDTGWVYINTTGRYLIRPYIFDNGPDYFQEGLARYTRQDKFGFFNQAGEIVIPAQFDFAYPFSEGLAAVCTGCRFVSDGEHRTVEGGKWGYIERQGKMIISIRFESADSFQDGRAQVKLSGKEIIIDTKGNPVNNDESPSSDMKHDSGKE